MRLFDLEKVTLPDKGEEGRKKKTGFKAKIFRNNFRKELLARLTCKSEADSLQTETLIECLSTHLWLVR